MKACKKLAIQQIYRCENSSFKHFSFLVQRGNVVSVGWNRHVGYKTIYTRDGKTYSEHAEYRAYQRGKGLLKHGPWEMVNLRITCAYELRMAKPCNICVSFLRSVGCSKITYTVGESHEGVIYL